MVRDKHWTAALAAGRKVAEATSEPVNKWAHHFHKRMHDAQRLMAEPEMYAALEEAAAVICERAAGYSIAELLEGKHASQ